MKSNLNEEVRSTQPLPPEWEGAIRNSIQKILSVYKENKGLILTEGDLECLLFSSLMEQPEFNKFQNTKTKGWTSGSIHSQVTWFREDNESGFEADLTILNPQNLDINTFELVQDYPNKGFFYDGPVIAIELKFIRTDVPSEIRKKAKEDYEHVVNKLRPAKIANIEKGNYLNVSIDNVDFIVLIGCKTKSLFETATKEMEGTIAGLNCPPNVFPIIFCQDDIKFFNNSKYTFRIP